MKYIIELNGERHEVELNGSSALVGDVELAASLEAIDGTPLAVVTLGDEVHRVIVRRLGGRGRYVLSVDGHRFEVEALDERARTIRDITAAVAKPSGPAPIVAPMRRLAVTLDTASMPNVSS